MISKYLLPVCNFTFHSLNSFSQNKILILMKSNLTNYVFYCLCIYFYIVSERSLPDSRSLRFLLTISSKYLIVVHWLSTVHFELIFVKKNMWRFIFLIWILIVLMPFVEKILFFHLILCILFRNWLSYVGLFVGSLFYSLNLYVNTFTNKNYYSIGVNLIAR